MNYVLYICQLYAWQMIFGGIVIYYIFTKLLKPTLESKLQRYENYRKKKEEQDYDAKYHKDPDVFAARISAQQAYTQKLQEKYDQQANEYQAKLKEKQIQKMLNPLDGANNSKFKSLRPDYNPLMGPQGPSNYRPAKRSKCGGGGCG